MEQGHFINPADLVPMDLFTADLPLRVDVAYTQDAPKSFCGAIYRTGARLWLHRDLAVVVLRAAARARADGYGLVLYDGLRTSEAQALMRRTRIVRENPQWLEGETRMLSPPGRGAHPRGMAIDVTLYAIAGGALCDMGTAFDAMPEKGAGPGPDSNPAHRDSPHICAAARENRARLTRYMMAGADGQALLPLPQEWWDYRFPAEIYNRYDPLSDADLPPQMRMTAQARFAPGPADFDDAHFARLRVALLKEAGLWPSATKAAPSL